ncbi:hypothetical protein RCL1_006955 [Eukaryota sp. TZLM3-RCL]
MRYVLLFVLLSVAFASIQVLTSENYDSTISSSPYVLVAYKATWCGHCKTLKPVWEELAKLSQSQQDLIIAEVDGDASKDIMKKEGIKGFPTIKLFKKGVEVKYQGPRDLNSFVSFLNKETSLGLPSDAPKAPVKNTHLTSHNFDSKIKGKCAFVKFYAPWCGHCQSLKAPYEQLVSAFIGERSVLISEVNCDEQKEICSSHHITGFPTLILFKADGSAVSFNQERSLDSMLAFVNENCNTMRNKDGSLPASFGRIPELDQIVVNFFKESDKEKVLAELQEKVNEIPVERRDLARFYYRTLQKSVEQPEYIKEQFKRLERLTSSGHVAADKITELVSRKNILAGIMSLAE